MRRIMASLLVISAACSVAACKKAPEAQTGTVERQAPQEQTGTVERKPPEEQTGTVERKAPAEK